MQSVSATKPPTSTSTDATSMASFEGNVGYNQDDATGFIKLNALRLRVRARTKK